jgi:hypothetical protein
MQLQNIYNLLQIAQYLDNRNWRYRLETDKSRIITGVKADNVEDFLIVITLKEDGEYLEVSAPQLLQVNAHVYN